MAKHGLIVVRGMARGIDGSAHRGTCAASREAALGAVGAGIDVISRKLFEEVAKRGAIITEFPHEGFSGAGRSDGAGSCYGAGSAISRRGLTMEFGSEVYGLPGDVTSRRASCEPTHQTARQAGDRLGEAVEELATEVRAELFPVEATSQQEGASLFEQNLSPIEK